MEANTSSLKSKRSQRVENQVPDTHIIELEAIHRRPAMPDSTRSEMPKADCEMQLKQLKTEVKKRDDDTSKDQERLRLLIDMGNERFKEYETRITELNQEVQDLESKYSRLVSRYKALQVKLETHHEAYKKLCAKRGGGANDTGFADGGEVIHLRNRIQDLESRLGEANKLRTECDKLLQEKRDFQMTAKKRARAEFSAEIHRLRTIIEGLKIQITSISFKTNEHVISAGQLIQDYQFSNLQMQQRIRNCLPRDGTMPAWDDLSDESRKCFISMGFFGKLTYQTYVYAAMAIAMGVINQRILDRFFWRLPREWDDAFHHIARHSQKEASFKEGSNWRRATMDFLVQLSGGEADISTFAQDTARIVQEALEKIHPAGKVSDTIIRLLKPPIEKYIKLHTSIRRQDRHYEFYHFRTGEPFNPELMKAYNARDNPEGHVVKFQISPAVIVSWVDEENDRGFRENITIEKGSVVICPEHEMDFQKGLSTLARQEDRELLLDILKEKDDGSENRFQDAEYLSQQDKMVEPPHRPISLGGIPIYPDSEKEERERIRKANEKATTEAQGKKPPGELPKTSPRTPGK